MASTNRKNRQTTRTERTSVDYPLWRKKVDNSVFRDGGTTIPNWACRTWDFHSLYPTNLRKRDPESQVNVTFGGSKFQGFVTCTHPKKRAQRVFRLWFSDELLGQLKEIYLMSFMRDLESRLREFPTDIEEEIAFWEFLDIEFDSSTKTFHLTAHYTQRPTFPELFRRLTYSPILKRMDDELARKIHERLPPNPDSAL